MEKHEVNIPGKKKQEPLKKRKVKVRKKVIEPKKEKREMIRSKDVIIEKFINSEWV